MQHGNDNESNTVHAILDWKASQAVVEQGSG